MGNRGCCDFAPISNSGLCCTVWNIMAWVCGIEMPLKYASAASCFSSARYLSAHTCVGDTGTHQSYLTEVLCSPTVLLQVRKVFRQAVAKRVPRTQELS